MRLDIETKTEIVQRLLKSFWKIPKPKLIMSIIGGTKYFSLSDRLQSNVINSIIDVASGSGI